MATFGPVRVRVDEIVDLSPNFRRIVFTGPDLDLDTDDHFYDQRIKLIFPSASGQLPELVETDEWYRAWLDIPEDSRGIMRTYSVRSATRVDDKVRLAIDFVMHEENGKSGPAATWAKYATIGSEIILIAPMQGAASGGIEFNRGEAQKVVLLGDETAAPAIARILEDLAKEGAEVPCTAYIEIPTEYDRLEITSAPHHEVTWLPRSGAEQGSRLAPALGWHVEDPVSAVSAESPDAPLLWETPNYSSAGEDLATDEKPTDGTYYWIAGESGVVKELRRYLVRDRGVDRSQVAFMGYWRIGVAMKG